MNKLKLAAGIAFLLLLSMETGCHFRSKNMLVSVHRDGSAEVVLYLHNYDHWTENPPNEGDHLNHKFGLSGTSNTKHNPFTYDVVRAEIADINSFKFHDITFSKSQGIDRTILRVKIPVGKDAIWMQEHPLVTQRYSQETVNTVFDLIGDDDEDEDFFSWSFTITPPGWPRLKRITVEGKLEEGTYTMDEEISNDSREAQLFIHDKAFRMKESAVLTWTIAY